MNEKLKKSKVPYVIRHPIKSAKRAALVGTGLLTLYSLGFGYLDTKDNGGNYLLNSANRAKGVIEATAEGVVYTKDKVNTFKDTYSNSNIESETREYIEKLRKQGQDSVADSLEERLKRGEIDNKNQLERISEALKETFK